MSPVKSAFLGLSAGLVAYVFAANVGGIFRPSDTGDMLADTAGQVVTESLAPGATKVTGGAKSSGTKLAPSAKVVAPTVTPSGTTVALVTPRSTNPATSTPTPSPAISRTPTPSPVVPRTNTPTPTPTPTPVSTPSPSVSPSLTATPTPTGEVPTPTPSLSPTPAPATTSRVVINEIAWSGTATSSNDEWLELYNAGDGAQELNGWSLCGDGLKIVTFSAPHRIDSGEFFLIERTDDATISDISGDYVGPFSKTLVDGGLTLMLRSGNCTGGALIDEVGPGAWYAGTASPKNSMERISSAVSSTDDSNWATWGTIPASDGSVSSTGLDAAGNPIRGTPKYQNSVSL